MPTMSLRALLLLALSATAVKTGTTEEENQRVSLEHKFIILSLKHKITLTKDNLLDLLIY